MSDYTPTTEQVRKAYMYDPEDEYRDPVNAPFRAKENGRQFDRWLAQHDADVRKQVAVVVRSYNAPVKVGDPAFRPSGYGEGEDCCARHIFGWFCCLPDGHEGEHVANGLTEVAAVWS